MSAHLRLPLKSVIGAAFACGLVALQSQDAVAAFSSTYTNTDDPKCHTVPQEQEEGPGSLERICPGPGSHKLIILAGDLRYFVKFGSKDAEFGPDFSSFNDIGKKMEWVSEDGRPIATILRYYLDTDGYNDSKYADANGRVKAQVLKVVKLPQNGNPGCAVAYVEASANKNANELARKQAYKTAGFKCGSDEPYTVGDLKFLFGVESKNMGLDQSRSQLLEQ